MFKLIPLTHPHLELYTVVDEADYLRLMERTWFAFRRNDGKYVPVASYADMPKRMHRVILGLTDPSIRVDHKNRDTLDNRRDNLRMANPNQSAMNRGHKLTSASGYKGVSKARNHWRVSIKHAGIVYHIGMFTDPVIGAKAYDVKAKELQGEFAVLNFPH